MFFSKHPALSPEIIDQLELELAKLRAEKLKVEVEQKKASGAPRKFDFEKAARFFVDHLPTGVQMRNYMGCTKMAVHLNMKRPEMHNAIRSLGYEGVIQLRDGRRKENRR